MKEYIILVSQKGNKIHKKINNTALTLQDCCFEIIRVPRFPNIFRKKYSCVKSIRMLTLQRLPSKN